MKSKLAWRKVDSMGKNYYVLDFKVAPNGSETYYPRLVAHNYSDTAAFDFWLRKMPRLEVSVKTRNQSFSANGMCNAFIL